MSSIPLADLKTHLNITGSSNDGELQDMLDAAEEWVAEQTGVPLAGGSLTFSVYASDGVLVLPTTTAVAVVSVTGPDGLAAAVDTRRTNLPSGIVTVRSPLCGTYAVTVTAPTAPLAGLVLSTLIIAAHLWETQRGTAPSALSLQGTDLDAPIPGFGYAIPNRARELLLPHLPPAVA